MSYEPEQIFLQRQADDLKSHIFNKMKPSPARFQSTAMRTVVIKNQITSKPREHSAGKDVGKQQPARTQCQWEWKEMQLL